MPAFTFNHIVEPAVKPQTSVTDVFSRPLEHLRISVTDRCDLRCAYCFPKTGPSACFLPAEHLLKFEEIERISSLLTGMGVRKIKLTGGEPLLRPRLTELIRRLSRLSGLEDISLTTNGTLLAEQAAALKGAGLDRVTVSLDTLDAGLYRELTGGGDLSRVLEGITAAQKVGLGPVKINAVIQRDVNHGQVLEMAGWARDQGLVLRFIEVMDVGTMFDWDMSRVYPGDLIREKIKSIFPLRPHTGPQQSSVARRYFYEDGRGEMGFISPVTRPFCGDCGRLRLSCDGKLFSCLFSEKAVDVRECLSALNDPALKEVLHKIWRERDDRYSENRSFYRSLRPLSRKVEMYRIGG